MPARSLVLVATLGFVGLTLSACVDSGPRYGGEFRTSRPVIVDRRPETRVIVRDVRVNERDDRRRYDDSGRGGRDDYRGRPDRRNDDRRDGRDRDQSRDRGNMSDRERLAAFCRGNPRAPQCDRDQNRGRDGRRS